jgi:hypothetical protein
MSFLSESMLNPANLSLSHTAIWFRRGQNCPFQECLCRSFWHQVWQLTFAYEALMKLKDRISLLTTTLSTVLHFSRTDAHKYTDHSVLPVQTWSSRQMLNPRSLDSSESSDQSLPIWLSISPNWHGICLLLTELLVSRSVLVSFSCHVLSDTALSQSEYWS